MRRLRPAPEPEPDPRDELEIDEAAYTELLEVLLAIEERMVREGRAVRARRTGSPR